MTTVIRPERSKKSQFWIDKHRYYELKHFCLQYPLWKENAKNIISVKPRTFAPLYLSNKINDPTADLAAELEYYEDRMSLVYDICKLTDYSIADYLFRGVTEERTYDYLYLDGMLCSRDYYYNKYREFFWLLSRERN